MNYLSVIEKPVINGAGLATANYVLRNDRNYVKNVALGAASAGVGMLASHVTGATSMQPLMDGIGYAIVNGVMNRDNTNARSVVADLLFGTGVSATTIGVVDSVNRVANKASHGSLYSTMPSLNYGTENYI